MNRFQVAFFWFFMFLALSTGNGCVPATSALQVPSLTPIAPTQITKPATPIPTATKIVSPEANQTPLIPSVSTSAFLNPTGHPYLVYSKRSGESLSLFLINADGTLGKIISLPEKSYITGKDYYLNNNPGPALSPNGEWLVFYQGIAVKVGRQFQPDSALYLMHLPDGEITKLSNLLPTNYPQNLEIIYKEAIFDDPFWASINKQWMLDSIKLGFEISLFQFQWSPDGQYLAFSSAVAGPSSDVYEYDIQSKAITRLTNGPRMVETINWFPDGKRIFHSANFGSCEGDCSEYYVTDLAGNGHKINNFDTDGGGHILLDGLIILR